MLKPSQNKDFRFCYVIFIYAHLLTMVFVVWIPAVFLGRMIVGDSKEQDDWKVIFQFSPTWMKLALLGIFIYL